LRGLDVCSRIADTVREAERFTSRKGGQRDGPPVYGAPMSASRAGVDHSGVWAGSPVAPAHCTCPTQCTRPAGASSPSTSGVTRGKKGAIAGSGERPHDPRDTATRWPCSSGNRAPYRGTEARAKCHRGVETGWLGMGSPGCDNCFSVSCLLKNMEIGWGDHD
jgi:hypothetical protein